MKNILSTFIHFLYTFHADWVYLRLVNLSPIGYESTIFARNK
nr:MAG TPA: hypothetical protein [Caudoviricetes sp.]DAT71780.1 MAG TPA: hypothetical protein [Caudoviricetes sp.]